MTQLFAAAAMLAALSHPGLLPIDPPKDGAVFGTVAHVIPQRPYEALICSYPWDCQRAYRIAQCESGLNPNSYSDGNVGLFQINSRAHAGRVGGAISALFDPETNVRIAHDLWLERGWQPWQYCSSR